MWLDFVKTHDTLRILRRRTRHQWYTAHRNAWRSECRYMALWCPCIRSLKVNRSSECTLHSVCQRRNLKHTLLGIPAVGTPIVGISAWTLQTLNKRVDCFSFSFVMCSRSWDSWLKLLHIRSHLPAFTHYVGLVVDFKWPSTAISRKFTHRPFVLFSTLQTSPAKWFLQISRHAVLAWVFIARC